VRFILLAATLLFSFTANAATLNLELAPDLYSSTGDKAEFQLLISGQNVSYGGNFDLDVLASSQNLAATAVVNGIAYDFQITSAAGDLTYNEKSQYPVDYWTTDGYVSFNLVETQSNPGIETNWTLYSQYVENGFAGCGDYDFCRADYGMTLVQSGGESYHYIGKAPAAFVPIPAAAWLFGSGLGLLGWFRRRQTA
jgi:hypothetical protein